MTTLAVLADIHGNLPALQAVVEDLAQFDVDHVVVAGDVINWGPFSAQVVEYIVAEGWAVIRGNAEYYLLNYGTPRAPAEWNDPANYPMLPWLHRQLAGRLHTLIAAWPDSITLYFPDAPAARVVHGSPRSAWEPIYALTTVVEVDRMLGSIEETTIIAGHTHLAMDRHVGGRHVVNPGAVGVPLDGRPGASYMLLEGTREGWRAKFRRVAFDDRPLFAEYERQRFVEECGVVGHLTVEEFRTARLQVGPFLRWRADCCPDAPFSNELIEAFNAADKWRWTPPAYRVNMEDRNT